ncbi:MAG TPA: phage holin family protein [Thermoanaerobaculia bacterium]|jgi:uncharacterized membrane protein YqjE
MSAEHDLPGEEEERSWGERIGVVAEAWSALVQTRLAIFREELAAKATLLVKGVVAAVIGLGLAIGALLLLAALLVAVLAHWFGSVGFGILGALVLYAAGAGAAVAAAGKWLKGVKPTEFPASADELRRDWRAVSESWRAESEAAAGPEVVVPPPRPPDALGTLREDRVENLEDRYRAGAE